MRGLRALSYRAALDISEAARTASAWLAAHRRSYDLRPHQRAATPWGRAVMLLRRLIEAASAGAPARRATDGPGRLGRLRVLRLPPP